jgi:hypothetical protein
LQFDAATDFKDGIARVGIKKVEPDPKQPGKAREVTYYGFIDKTGRYIAQPIWRDDQEKIEIAKQFNEGIGWIDDTEGKRNYIDATGKVVIADLDSGGDFQEGLAVATRGKQQGFINHKGQFVISVSSIESAKPFSEGLAPRYDDNEKRWGYMEKEGNWAIKPQFESVRDFQDGLACVTINSHGGLDPRYGNNLINRKGQILLPLESAEPLAADDCAIGEGLFSVSTRSGNGYMNSEGKFVIRPQFENAQAFSEGLAAVSIKTVSSVAK